MRLFTAKKTCFEHQWCLFFIKVPLHVMSVTWPAQYRYSGAAKPKWNAVITNSTWKSTKNIHQSCCWSSTTDFTLHSSWKNESEIEDPIASNHARSVSTHVRWPLWTFTCQQPVITDYLCCCCKTNNQIIIDTDKQISWAFKHTGGDWAVNVIHRVAWETLVPACSHETDAGT